MYTDDTAHTHQPLPPAPLRSAMKQTSPVTSPATSPFISRVPLPGASLTTSPTSSTAPLPSTPPSGLLSPYSIYSPTPSHAASALSTPYPATASSVNSSTSVNITGNHDHHHVRNLSPTPGYTPKVSFDTFENPMASMFSFTLQVKSEGYRRTRNTRVFLCATSPDESGREALDWCLESLVQDGDELIVFRGIDEEVFEKDHNVVREEARDLMRTIQEKSVEYDSERKLSLVLEYIPGKITDTLDRLIALYRPDSVVVGTRGRKTWQAIGVIGMGSVSKYCLSHSPVPVIVVRPERKLRKAVEKRRADPKRGKHFEGAILTRRESRTRRIITRNGRLSIHRQTPNSRRD
ncbi:hypothetical protein BDQ12DRAFT_707558 [Crucibulum laeve]|uniref:UspA domain-containing protein n=1 Tax=Crucibulum laeve TaxID=68775 RepID=A0A5C3LIM4_9AGAR|nr:hypothetical protein BDQ12DRAFT_707558 [Crucibulum laeve]